MRTWENHLDMASYNPEPFRAVAAGALADDLVIRSLAELADDPDRFPKLYDLVEAVSIDVPTPQPRTPRKFDDQWISRVMDNPGLLADAYLIAVDESLPDRPYVALSNLWRNQATDDIDTGLTGVRREYRRRGLAIALKLACLDKARAMGAPRVRTWNASNNVPMLAINEQLGFVKQPAWIEYLREPAADGLG
jgi:RimJ/RimL family protein N-acetyltransferase